MPKIITRLNQVSLLASSRTIHYQVFQFLNSNSWTRVLLIMSTSDTAPPETPSLSAPPPPASTSLNPTQLAYDLLSGLLNSSDADPVAHLNKFQSVISTLNNILDLYDPSGVVSSLRNRSQAPGQEEHPTPAEVQATPPTAAREETTHSTRPAPPQTASSSGEASELDD